jgi:hypothetical protein
MADKTDEIIDLLVIIRKDTFGIVILMVAILAISLFQLMVMVYS